MRISDRDALDKYRETCENDDLNFRLKAIYKEDANGAAGVRLTDCQREALDTAHNLGYFEIPRQATLADVVEQCGASSQAASERLRRGIGALIDTVP
jgi:predicted DNA binding protein